MTAHKHHNADSTSGTHGTINSKVGYVQNTESKIDTDCHDPPYQTLASGATYVNTEKETTSCPKVEGCGWQTGYNRTDDPLGADLEKLVSTEGLRVYVDSLELTGDYRTEFYLGESLDLSGMKVVAANSCPIVVGKW